MNALTSRGIVLAVHSAAATEDQALQKTNEDAGYLRRVRRLAAAMRDGTAIAYDIVTV